MMCGYLRAISVLDPAVPDQQKPNAAARTTAERKLGLRHAGSKAHKAPFNKKYCWSVSQWM